MRETLVRFLGWEDPLEKGKATHSSILAWEGRTGRLEDKHKDNHFLLQGIFLTQGRFLTIAGRFFTI